MSRTTEILLHVGPTDDHHLEDLSFWLRDQAPRSDDRVEGSAGHLLPLTGQLGMEAWGGDKAPVATLWAGVANYLDFDALVDRVGRVLWDEPDRVQLLLRDDGDPWFRLYMIRDGRIRRHGPAPASEDQDRLWEDGE